MKVVRWCRRWWGTWHPELLTGVGVVCVAHWAGLVWYAGDWLTYGIALIAAGVLAARPTK